MARFPGEGHELTRSGAPVAPRPEPAADPPLVRQVAPGAARHRLRRPGGEARGLGSRSGAGP
jgi:hypothetical protein